MVEPALQNHEVDDADARQMPLVVPARVKLVVASFFHPIIEYATGRCGKDRGFAAAALLAPTVDNWAAHRTSLWTVG